MIFTRAKKSDDAYGAGRQTERTDYSTVYQRDVIDKLRSSGKHDAFYDAVDMLQRNGKPHDSQANSPASYAAVADRLRNEVMALSNGEIDLENGSHSVSVSDLWHSYSKHCLDSFIEDGHLNLTHDDLRMIPDIVENYDSVKLIDAKKGYTLEFTKQYGDALYVVAETIGGKNDNPRGTRQKTIYLNEITKKASSRAFHPTSFSKNFTRTEIVNPVTAFIKQNYAAEARKGSVSDLLVIILGSIRFHEVKSLNVRLRIRSVIKNAFLQFYKHSK